MPAGLSGAGYLAIVLETVNGTYLHPATAGAKFVPILSESLKYTEEKYFSPQIRQATEVSDVKQGFYHAEGDIEMEVDPDFLPYFMHCSRHTITKSGAGPYTYKYTPSTAGATSTAASGNVQRTASITVIRNGKGFGYAGCTLGGYQFTLGDDGVLKVTLNVLGLSETDPVANLGTPTWATPNLIGAAGHYVYTAASAASPTFGATSTDFNGFTFGTNFNAEAQNRINALRSAAYIKFGESEHSFETELDFIDRTEYDAFVANTQKAYRFESLNGGATLAAATSGIRLQANRAVFETYDLGLSGLGDTIMAGVTARPIGIASGDAIEVHVKTAVANIT
jgi:hypothetical protein